MLVSGLCIRKKREKRPYLVAGENSELPTTEL